MEGVEKIRSAAIRNWTALPFARRSHWRKMIGSSHNTVSNMDSPAVTLMSDGEGVRGVCVKRPSIRSRNLSTNCQTSRLLTEWFSLPSRRPAECTHVASLLAFTDNSQCERDERLMTGTLPSRNTRSCRSSIRPPFPKGRSLPACQFQQAIDAQSCRAASQSCDRSQQLGAAKAVACRSECRMHRLCLC